MGSGHVFWMSDEVKLLKFPFSRPGDGNIQEVAVVLRREIPCNMHNMYLQDPTTLQSTKMHQALQKLPSSQGIHKPSHSVHGFNGLTKGSLDEKHPHSTQLCLRPPTRLLWHSGTIKYTQACNQCHTCHVNHYMYPYVIILPTKSHSD